MKLKEIIEKLCSHEISKQDAIEQITIITDGLRRNNALEFTVEQINEHIKKFTPIYKDGKEINPIPKNRKVTVWCEGTNEEGFACNVTADEMGLEVLIAKSWIYEDELQTLCGG